MTSNPNTPSRDGEAEFLATYDITKYPQPSVTVDLAVFTIRDGVFSVLLVERGAHPYKGYWALPGGFLNEREPTAEAAWRELFEETGVEQFSGHLEQLRTYSDRDRDPRGWIISVAHVAFAPNLPDPKAGTDAANARWWAVKDLNLDGDQTNPDAPALGFDHADILRDAIERVRSKIEYTTLATEFVTAPFTLPELHRVYEAVWGSAPNLSNFRRKAIKTPGFVVSTDEARDADTATTGRPPLLYRKGAATTLHPAMLRPSADHAATDLTD